MEANDLQPIKGDTKPWHDLRTMYLMTRIDTRTFLTVAPVTNPGVKMFMH